MYIVVDEENNSCSFDHSHKLLSVALSEITKKYYFLLQPYETLRNTNKFVANYFITQVTTK